jgi:hypothetical protein
VRSYEGIQYVRCMSEALGRSVPVTSFIEEFFSAPLDPEFVASVPDLRSDIIVNLFESYRQFTESFSARTRDMRELTPVNHNFPSLDSRRDPLIADEYLRRAMSQLLYAHRCAFVDSLGYNLARWSHPVKEYETALAWDSETQYRVGLQNYFETLMYLRPLMDAGLVDILPFVPDRDPPNVYNEITFGEGISLIAFPLALEAVKGVEYGRGWLKAIAKKGRAYMPLDHTESEELFGLQRAFHYLIKKLTPPWVKAGDLSLETPQQMQALRYLLSNGLVSNAWPSRAKVMAEVETLALPQIESLQPSDIVALHSRSEWEDFRLALSHGLERADIHAAGGHQDRLRYIAEELATVGRAADRATKKSKLGDERRKAGRDVIIGIAVASGLTPLTGPTPALLGAAGVGARSIASLTWAWLTSRREEGSLQAAINCFTACGKE